MENTDASALPWPATLDLGDWLRYCLADPDAASRRLVLEEFAAVGLPPEFLAQVEDMASSDPSPECRVLAGALIGCERRKGEAAELAAGFEATPESLRELVEQAEPALRKALLTVPWRSPAPELLDLWRDRLVTEQVPEVITIGLSLLARSGRPADAGLALAFLGSSSPEVARSALDLLFEQDRGLLVEHLAGPLAHPNLDVRFHAIGRLAAIDLPKALRILNEAIEGSEPLVRRRAIRELSRLPAEATTASSIRVLGLEVQPLLLVQAGAGLVTRPSLDLPPYIYDALLISKGIKKHILELILRRVVQEVQAAGLLTVSPAAYLEGLKRELEARRADLLVALTLRDLRHPEAEVRRQGVERLAATLAAGPSGPGTVPLSEDPRIQKALRTRERLETDPGIKERVQSLLASAAPAAPEALPTPLAPSPLPAIGSEAFSRMSVREQVTGLAAIADREAFLQARDGLLTIVGTSAERPVVVTALKVFEAFGTAADADHLMPLLKSGDPGLIGCALRAIARLDFERVATAINPFLRDENLAIKVAALEAYLTFDKDGAMQYLQSMLATPVAAIRRKALTLAPLVDFPSIESLLVAILEKDPRPDIQAQAGFLLASNPSEAGLDALFRHAHPSQSQAGQEAAELWEMARPQAARFFRQPAEEIDIWLAARQAAVEVPTTVPAPGAGARPIRGQSPPSFLSELGRPRDWAAFLCHRRNLAVIGLFGLLFLPLALLESPPWPSPRSYRVDSMAAVAGQDGRRGGPGEGNLAAGKGSPGWTILPGVWLDPLARQVEELRSELASPTPGIRLSSPADSRSPLPLLRSRIALLRSRLEALEPRVNPASAELSAGELESLAAARQAITGLRQTLETLDQGALPTSSATGEVR